MSDGLYRCGRLKSQLKVFDMIDSHVEDPMIIVLNKYEGLIRDGCAMLSVCEVFVRKVVHGLI